MAGMLILKPLPIAALAAGGTGLDNLKTASPREIWIAPSGYVELDVDLGSVQEFDSIYLGNTNAETGGVWASSQISGLGGTLGATIFSTTATRLTGSIRSRHPAFVRTAAPVSCRYLRLAISQVSAPIQSGNLVIGKAFEAPYAYGSGRQPVDTSKVVALPDGGFGIERGVVKSSLSWRFADLDNAQLETLWALAEDRGESAPLVVVEGPDYPPKAPSVHYGLFRRFEAFEREDAAFTKWQLSIEEWR